MATYNPAKVADAIAAILRRHAVDVGVDASALSASRYLNIAAGERRLRVRVSDHVARPTYEALNGTADIEIGTHDMASTSSAVHGADRILRKLAVPRDRYLRAALTRADIKAIERATADAVVRKAAEARDAQNQSVQQQFEVWAADRLNFDGLNAKQRKRRRQKLRAEFTVATGLEWK